MICEATKLCRVHVFHSLFFSLFVHPAFRFSSNISGIDTGFDTDVKQRERRRWNDGLSVDAISQRRNHLLHEIHNISNWLQTFILLSQIPMWNVIWNMLYSAAACQRIISFYRFHFVYSFTCTYSRYWNFTHTRTRIHRHVIHFANLTGIPPEVYQSHQANEHVIIKATTTFISNAMPNFVRW